MNNNFFILFFLLYFVKGCNKNENNIWPRLVNKQHLQIKNTTIPLPEQLPIHMKIWEENEKKICFKSKNIKNKLTGSVFKVFYPDDEEKRKQVIKNIQKYIVNNIKIFTCAIGDAALELQEGAYTYIVIKHKNQHFTIISADNISRWEIGAPHSCLADAAIKKLGATKQEIKFICGGEILIKYDNKGKVNVKYNLRSGHITLPLIEYVKENYAIEKEDIENWITETYLKNSYNNHKVEMYFANYKLLNVDFCQNQIELALDMGLEVKKNPKKNNK
jgi:hypothetical protein